MLALLVAAAQVAAPLAPAPSAPPGDISIRATLDAKSVKIIKKGTATINAHAAPDAGSTAVSSGNTRSRHFEVQIDARIGDPLSTATELEPQATDSDQPR